MGNQQQDSVVTFQPGLQPQDGRQVEVIGRFIEQQNVRAAHQRLGQVQTHPPTAGKRLHRPAGCPPRRIPARSAGGPPGLRRHSRRCVPVARTARAGPSSRRASPPTAMSRLQCAQLTVAVHHEIQRRALTGRALLGHVGDKRARRRRGLRRDPLRVLRAAGRTGMTCRCRWRPPGRAVARREPARSHFRTADCVRDAGRYP